MQITTFLHGKSQKERMIAKKILF